MTDMTVRTPWHLWLMGILALLFEIFGCFQFLVGVLGGDEMVRQSAVSMGWTAAQAETYITWAKSLPMWLKAVWAVGVWGGLAAAILLLLRRRLAAPLFVLSLLMFVLNAGFTRYFTNAPDFVNADIVVPSTIFVFCLLFAVYASVMQRRGVLR